MASGPTVRVLVCELPTEDDRLLLERWTALVAEVKAHLTGGKPIDLVVLPELPFHPWLFTHAIPDSEIWNLAVEKHQTFVQEHFGELGGLDEHLVIASTRPTASQHNQAFLWSASKGFTPVHNKSLLPNEDGVWERNWYFTGPMRQFEISAIKLRSGESVKVAFQTCSEMWFSDEGRKLGGKGADLILCPRATERASVAKWVIAGQALALCSGAFIVSANRFSTDGTFGGSSFIVHPNDASVQGPSSNEKPFLVEDLDLSVARKAKQSYPRNILETPNN